MVGVTVGVRVRVRVGARVRVRVGVGVRGGNLPIVAVTTVTNRPCYEATPRHGWPEDQRCETC